MLVLPPLGRVPPTDPELYAFLQTVKEGLERIPKFLPQVAAPAAANNLVGSGTTTVITNNTGGYTPPPQDLTAPPAPTGLTANAAFVNIILQWDAPTYANHGYTQIFSNTVNTLGTAVQVGTAIAALFAHAVGTTGLTRYYWIRHVKSVTNLDGTHTDITGPYNAVSGVSATTAKVNTGDIANLAVTSAQILSLTADKIIAASLSAVSANLGIVTAGLMRNGSNTTFFDLNAIGSQVALQVASGALRIQANGAAFFAGSLAAASVTAANLSVATLSSITANIGTMNAGVIYDSAFTKYLNLNSVNGSTADYFIYSPNFWVRGDGFVFIGSSAQINGTLNAVNGVFSGSLSAANIVGTAQIAPGAVVTNSIGANQVTNSSSANGSPVAIGTSGGSLLIIASGTLNQGSTASLKIGSTVIGTFTNQDQNNTLGFVIARTVFPAAGFYQISVTANTSNFSVSNIIALETLR